MFILSLLQNPLMIIIFLVVLVATISIHEFAHAYTADKLGDPTPSLAGRLTLNPTAHLDLWGSILFLLVGFGWGKPVPFDPYNLENPRRDAAIISFAGPLSNIAIALLCSAILYLTAQTDGIHAIVSGILAITIQLNITLAIFNLLPFAPLDGFKIVEGLLPEDQAHDWHSLERYGILFLVVMLVPFSGSKSMLELFIFPIIRNITTILTP